MPVLNSRTPRLALVGACALILAGCGTFDRMTSGIAGSITPYRMEVVQGNFVSREQVELLRPGMSRSQVRDILGTPLVTSLFHANRWDYVFTLRRQNVEPQQRKLSVFFTGELLQRVEGDPMPSESEFVATLEHKRRKVVVPELQASEEKLKAFSAGRTAAEARPAAAPAAPPPNTTYPPLEPPQR